STLLNTCRPSRLGVDDEQGLLELDGLGVLDQNFHDNTRGVGQHLVHELHSFDDPDWLPALAAAAHLYERLRAWGCGPVKGADQRRQLSVARRGGSSRCASRRGTGSGHGWSRQREALAKRPLDLDFEVARLQADPSDAGL